MEFIPLRGFLTAWRKLKLSQSDYRHLLDLLTRSPHAGNVIPGSGGWRKLRIQLPGRGKRGGGRIIYAILANPPLGQMLLGAVYSKSEKEDLSPGELFQMTKLLNQLTSEQ